MSIKTRIRKLEVVRKVGKLPMISVIVLEGDDQEAIINEKLKLEGLKRDQCGVIITRIFKHDRWIPDGPHKGNQNT